MKLKSSVKDFAREHRVMLVILLCFILLRLFTADSYYFVAGDQAKYLSIVNALPEYTPYNNEMWVLHPPVYPYLVKPFSFVLPDYIAAILVSFLASIAAFIGMWKLLELFEKRERYIAIAMVPFTISILSITLSKAAMKETLFLAFLFWAIYFYVRGLKEKDSTKYLAFAGILAGLCALTTDIGAFIVVMFLGGMFLFRERWKELLIPIILLGLLYTPWIYTRYSVYSTHTYYPASVDSIIERVDTFSFIQLVSPTQFEEITKIVGFSNDLDPGRIGLKFTVMLISPIRNMPNAGAFFHFALLGVCGLLVATWAVKGLKKCKRFDLFFGGTLLLTLAPLISTLTGPRFIIWSILPISYFILRGVQSIEKIKDREINVILAFVIIFTLFFLVENQNFVFTLQKEAKSTELANYLNTLPPGNIMTEFSYSPSVGYLTNLRVYGIPSTSELLERYVEMYNISYIVHDQRYSYEGIIENQQEAIEYVMNNPQKFELLTVIVETYKSRDAAYLYSDRSAIDIEYVYRVVGS